jgi:plastocyanin
MHQAHASTANVSMILRLIRSGNPTILRGVRICNLVECSMRRLAWAGIFVAFAAAGSARADVPSFAIALQNNQFVPNQLTIPAGVKVKLVVKNANPVPSEFESTQLHREQVVTAGQQITVYVGPLDPGAYEFFDDFHPTTRGHLIVK